VQLGDRQINWSSGSKLDLPVPTLLVDTTSGYAPTFEAIVAFVRAAGSDQESGRTALG